MMVTRSENGITTSSADCCTGARYALGGIFSGVTTAW